MIICHRCGKENQDHYKFCLGCGAELTGPPRTAARSSAPAPPDNLAMMNTVMSEPGQSPTPPGMGQAGAYGMGAPPPPMPPMPPGGGVMGHGAPDMGAGNWRSPGSGGVRSIGGEPPAGPRPCPACGSAVPPEFKFCGVCGHKMEPLARPAARPPQPQLTARWAMVLIRPDGTEGGVHHLHDGENRIGRDHGEIFENDGYLSPTHAALIVQKDTVIVRDLGSLNGVFVKMIEDEALQPGQVLRIGQELLRFDIIESPQPMADGTEVMGSPNPGFWGKITVVIGNGVDGSAYPLLNESITLGRERGEINFPEDGYVSGLHARLTHQNGMFVLSDLGSSNGTFIRVQSERVLTDGSFILLGQQLFRLSIL
ncbi:MAG TPA: FHA domain-containing protein [Haliangium sp.]|nr:FHA domain-containing protein [Haliangium sp.]